MHAAPNLFVFGLTGGVASGKSTVSGLFERRGVVTIDADDLARQVVSPGSPALVEITDAFGPAVVPHGELDRAKLAKQVFADSEALARLNRITHPRVAALFEQQLARLAVEAAAHPQPLLVAYDVPLLFENGLERRLHPVVLVACPEALQLRRAVQRDGWTPEHAQQRIDAQMPLAEKRRLADLVIENDSTLPVLEQRVDVVLHALRQAAAATPNT